MSSRGTPAMIWSNNGTNFIGAEKKLRESVEKWNIVNIAADLARKDIKWRFHSPSAPHQGGIWESWVRSFKRVLYTILGTRRLTDEVLHTTFCLEDNALNSRALTPVSADPCDLNALMTNHFFWEKTLPVSRLLSVIVNLTIVNVTPARSRTLMRSGPVGSESTYRC